MAKIILGVGSSHGPTIQTPPERWYMLGQKDREDPRYDYAAALEAASPAMENEITAQKMQERYDACQEGIRVLSVVIADAAVDAIIVISNPHGVPPANRMDPVFGIYLSGTDSQVGRSGHQPSGQRGPATDAQLPLSRSVEPYSTMPSLADHLMENLVLDGFDLASCFQSDPAAGIEGPFMLPYERFLPDRETPVVPFLLSRYLPHQATPARCYALGQSIRAAVDSWDSEARVAIFASGGLSHQIIDEEQDRAVIKALEDRDADAMKSLDRSRLNKSPGTPETLNWIVVAGALEELPMTLVDYQPCYRSMAGTGHGVTFGYWQ
jgi:3-O-methylgallate 3,4-dioxygenase